MSDALTLQRSTKTTLGENVDGVARQDEAIQIASLPMIDLPTVDVLARLARVGQGDATAGAELYTHYFDFLYAFVRFRVPDDHSAEDIAQEIFYAILSKPSGFSGNSKFSTWLCGIAKFKIADWRRDNRQFTSLFEQDPEVIESLIDPNWDFTIELGKAQDREVVFHCFDRLSSSHKHAVYSVYYMDSSIEETASSMDCPEGTVQSRLFHARLKLKSCLQTWLKGGRHG